MRACVLGARAPENMIAAYGTSRMTAIELPRHNAVMPAVRTISAAVRMPDEIVKGRDVLTWYMIFTRSIGAVSSLRRRQRALLILPSARRLSFSGIGWPETVCRRLRLRGGVRCGPLSGGGDGGSDELEALLLDGDDAMRRAWIVACEVGARYVWPSFGAGWRKHSPLASI